jgi:hypothetical protein
MTARAAGTLVLVLTLLAGCGSAVRLPDLGGIYDAAAAQHDALRNPVIVIPGILGSKLVDEESGRVVWGAFAGGYANPERPDGARLVALPMTGGARLAERRDAVRPDGALDRLKVELLGLPVELDAYLQILGTLGVGGYRDEQLGMAGAVDYGDDHFTCFQFDYDWRRDNVENARRLHEFILEKRAYVQREIAERYGTVDADVKFDIVAHSMGGLITRYFLRYGAAEPSADGDVPWTGAAHVERAILVATPNAGSAHAVTQLVDGVKFAFFLPRYGPAVLGTMPSIYQLLPRTRHGAVVDADGAPVDVLDPAVWDRYGWGLASPAADADLAMLLPDETPTARRRVARAHQRQCLERAGRFFAALDRPADPPAGLTLTLIAGDAVPTASRLAVARDGSLSVQGKAPGDGTVLRTSALMDERVGSTWQRGLVSPVAWRQVTFLFTDHLGLTSDPGFTDNVLYQLLEEPRQGTGLEPRVPETSRSP